MPDYNEIEKSAYDLLVGHNLLGSVPIKLEELLQKLKIHKEERDLGEEISGLLVIKPSMTTIGLDKNQGDARKNFTIAHEIGHFVLHQEEKKMFVDETIAVFARSGKSNNIEREANAFAAALLMPKVLIHRLIDELGIDSFTISDEQIKNLAEKFQVSQIAMTYRLANLGIINLS
ncbi:MAG: ImmA/IrrE family metallo-endopeptidase [Cyclobacteriaceae bacterium]